MRQERHGACRRKQRLSRGGSCSHLRPILASSIIYLFWNNLHLVLLCVCGGSKVIAEWVVHQYSYTSLEDNKPVCSDMMREGVKNRIVVGLFAHSQGQQDLKYTTCRCFHRKKWNKINHYSCYLPEATYVQLHSFYLNFLLKANCTQNENLTSCELFASLLVLSFFSEWEMRF